MNDEMFVQQMSMIADAARENRWKRVRKLVRALDRELTEPADPECYGWVYFYGFKAAYMLEDYHAAFEMLSGPARVAVMPPKNGAWMASVGAEVAVRLGQVGTAVEQGRRCIEIRRNQDDTAGVVMGARTMCALLGQFEAEHRAGEFAEILIDSALEIGDVRSAAFGYRALARSLRVNPNPLRIDRLIEARDWLEANKDERWADEALTILLESPHIAEREAARAAAEAMWNAAMAGDVDEIERHLDSGLDPSTPWTFGRNSLHAGALAGNVEVVERLLERGARPNIRTVQGRTALHFAAEFGYEPIAAMLLERGADRGLEDIFGLTAVDLAEREGHTQVAATLRHAESQ